MTRRILIAAAAVAVLTIAAVAAAAAFIPSDRIAAAVSNRVEARLGQPLHIDTIHLDLLPLPGVALAGVRLGDAGAPVATVQRVLLRPRILPLFTGRVVLREVRVEEPRLRLRVDSAGHANLALPGAAPPPGDTSHGAETRHPTAGPPPASGRGITFAVQRLVIDDGSIGYTDARDGTAVRLDGVRETLRISGALRQGRLSRIQLAGALAIDSIGAVLPGRLAVPVHGVRFAIDHDATFDADADRLTLDTVSVHIQRLALDGRGVVTHVSEPGARQVDVALATNTLDPDDLARSLPEGLLADLAPALAKSAASPLPRVSGSGSLAAYVQGPLPPAGMPAVNGTLDLAGVGIEQQGVAVLSGLGGRIAFSLDSVTTTGLNGRLFDAPFRLSFTASRPADPTVRFATSGTLPLATLARLAAVDSLGVAGTVAFDVGGTVRPLEKRAALSGGLDLQDVAAAPPGLLQRIQVPSGHVALDGAVLRLQDVRLAFGQSTAAVNGTVDSWLPRAFGDTTTLPGADVDVRAGLLDLDALTKPSKSGIPAILFARLGDRPVGGLNADQAAADAGLALPPLPPVNLTGRLRADRLVNNKLNYTNLDAVFTVTPEGVVIRSASFGIMGGTVHLSAAVRPEATGAAVSLDYTVSDVGAGPFFDRLTPFRGHLAGAFTLAGDAAMNLDSLALPVRSSVRASGSLAIRDGQLVNWPVLRTVGERLGLARLDTLPFNDWAGAFHIAGPLVTLDETALVGDAMDVHAAGSFDFGGHLDVGATLLLPAATAARAGQQIRAVAAAVTDTAGRVPVGVSIRGLAERPEVALDLSAARQNVVAKARAAAELRAKQAADQVVQEAAQRVLPDSLKGVSADSLRKVLTDTLRTAAKDSLGAELADSLKAKADSAKKALQQRLKSKLRRFIPPPLQDP